VNFAATDALLACTVLYIAGFGLLPVYGRFYLPIMNRAPLTCVLGKPIAVPLDKDPSPETVDKIHAEFLTAMQKLFDRHKTGYGWAHKSLIIS